MSEIAATEIVKALTLQPLDDDDLDGAQFLDGILIVRYQHPDWERPRMAYLSSDGMAEELRVGIVVAIADRVRAVCCGNWVDDE